MDEKRPDSPVSPIRASEEDHPESPTTAQPLNFDSDNEHEHTQTPTKPSHTESAPQPPPKDQPTGTTRPSAREQAEATLKDAFPTLDNAVIRAVLIASGGQVEPAFNALLAMTDPDSQKEPELQPEPAPPAMPPRPAAQATSTQMSQMEADEMYARQLAEHYENTARQQQPQQPRTRNRYNDDLQGSRLGRPGAHPDADKVPWRSFIDDDLPEIGENIKKGFFETQKTVNGWLTNFKKRMDMDDEDYEPPPQLPARPGTQQYNRNSNETRRSADLQRYDADPQVIGDDFSKLDLKDGDYPPRTTSRPLANPNLFKTTASAARSDSRGSGRKVSFQEQPEEIKDMYGSASPAPRPVSATKSSKWQPMATVDPSPVADNDPFSLGDSDDDKDAKPIVLKDDEDERLEAATSEALSGSIGEQTTGITKK